MFPRFTPGLRSSPLNESVVPHSPFCGASAARLLAVVARSAIRSRAGKIKENGLWFPEMQLSPDRALIVVIAASRAGFRG
jgi:hypothetical protein